MKTKTYKGQLVALLHKTSHRVSQLLDGRVVPTNELESRGWPEHPGKTQLTQDDHSRLNAARGLVFGEPRARSKCLPTVALYNLAIKCGEYIGAPIVPVGTAL